MARILRALGLHPVFRYEKFRTTYALPGVRGLKIELDETPVGIYLELEGPIARIDRGARSWVCPRRLHEGNLRLIIYRRLPTTRPKARQHALSANKKIAITHTLSLTKISTAFTY